MPYNICVVQVSTRLVVVTVVGLLLSSCGGEGVTPTTNPTLSATTPVADEAAVTAGPTRGPAIRTPPSPSPAPATTQTLRPSPVPTRTPVPTVAPTATATAMPDIADAPVSSSGPSPRPASGLWSGDLAPGPGYTGYTPPWLALRVRPGDDPDQDSWWLESGPRPGILPPVITCAPQRLPDGWELSCTGGWGDLTAFMHAEGDGGLEVTLQRTGFTAIGTLRRSALREEPRSTDNVTVLWHQPGEGLHTDIWAEDGLVFAPRSDGVIEIIGAADGAVVGDVAAWGEVYDVKAHDGFLYAATALLGLLVFDISDPAAPERIGQFEDFTTDNRTNFHNIFLSPDGRFVYAINSSSYPNTDLLILDVSDPNAPAEAGRFSIPVGAGYHFDVTHDVNVMEVDGRLIAFLNYQTAGLWILDVTDPAAISTLGSVSWDGIFSHSGWPFRVNGRIYYAHNSEGPDRHMTVLEVTDLANPTVVSRFATRRGLSIHNVQVVDGIAYVSYYVDGLRVVDLRDPERPEEIAHFDTVPDANERDILQGAWGVRVLDGVVYVSDIESGIFAFKVDVE